MYKITKTNIIKNKELISINIIYYRYGSVKSAHRRTGKIKGIERFLGAVDTLQESLIEVTSGQAKYEHQHRSIVWRMPRLPKEGQGTLQYNTILQIYLQEIIEIYFGIFGQ